MLLGSFWGTDGKDSWNEYSIVIIQGRLSKTETYAFVLLNLHLPLCLLIAGWSRLALIADASCLNPSSEKVACVVQDEGVYTDTQNWLHYV